MSPITTIEEAPGRYTHIREHGRGGMGRVLLVHDQQLERDIALKELLPKASPDDASMLILKSAGWDVSDRQAEYASGLAAARALMGLP